MKDAKGHGSDPRGAHSEGVQKVGRPEYSGITTPLDPAHRHFDIYVDQGFGTRRLGNDPKETIGAKSLRDAREAWKQVGPPSQTRSFRLSERKR